ncbi:MAG: hypothetical protein KatS3mg102_0508 [Planctomycetota bacterium]|nr:MAG: hypothetical protein KatS3mg102_0508 [Planctomycetota bacterium]
MLLLPHGYEGQGPEHSRRRLERFLQLGAEDNMQVASSRPRRRSSTALRRQVLRPWRKPLVVMAPKSLLRHPAAVSPLAELVEGGYRRVLPDPLFAGEGAPDPRAVERVLLCSGKIYYELDEARRRAARHDLAIVRLEQLYPLRREEVVRELERFPAHRQRFWVQEEPYNQGAWLYVWSTFAEWGLTAPPLRVIARARSASPATGSHASHALEQQQIIEAALDPRLDRSFETATR